MTMVNLLPWRQLRRRQLWRFWVLLSTGSLLMMGVLTFSLHRWLMAEQAVQRVMQKANRVQLQRFAEYQRQLLVREREDHVLQARQHQRTQTQLWQHTLLGIAGRLPARTWLTRLEFRQGNLMLNGTSLAFRELAQLDAVLRDIPGLQHGKAGKTQRDAQGRWQFHYQFSREQDRVVYP